jgi:RNA polymerase sigma factor (sigma-70 family)
VGGVTGGEPSDADVIRSSLGNPAEFSRIFERHVRPIHRYLQRATSTSAADDLTAEVFVSAFKSRRRYDLRMSDARPWLFGIAANMVRHHFRSERRRRSLLERVSLTVGVDAIEDDPTDQLLERSSQTHVLQRALSSLDPRLREVLLLDAGPEMSDEEIARALAIPVGTVKSRLARGRRQLKNALGSTGQDMAGIPEESRP